MINPTKSIISNEEEDFRNFLITVHLFKIFEPLFDLDWVDRITFKQLVRYIVQCYSLEQGKYIQGMSWRKNKEAVFESEKLPVGFYEDIVMLKSETVRKVIQSWLNFIDDDTLTQLKTLKDLRVEMQVAAVSPLKKTGDPLSPTDFDMKMQCAKYSKELLIMIKDLETTLIQNNPMLKEAMQELKKSSKNGLTIGPETFSK